MSTDFAIFRNVAGIKIAELTDRAERAEAECLEQARLLGISGSREASLIARAEKAETELAAMSIIAEKWEADALRYARNVEYWQSRAEKAEAALVFALETP